MNEEKKKETFLQKVARLIKTLQAGAEERRKKRLEEIPKEIERMKLETQLLKHKNEFAKLKQETRKKQEAQMPKFEMNWGKPK